MDMEACSMVARFRRNIKSLDRKSLKRGLTMGPTEEEEEAPMQGIHP